VPLLSQQSGCKVGWEIWDNEAEAMKRSEEESKARERMFKQGYDFGYQWPGAVKKLDAHPDYDGKDVWVVVTT